LHGVHQFVLAHGDDHGVAEAGLIVMLGTVIELLSAFIGEDLALRLVWDAWPELAEYREDIVKREQQA
jgi:hypothetical protein